MPFDGAERIGQVDLLQTMSEQLDRVIGLLAREDQWCKGRTETPDRRHCIIGAIHAARADRVLKPVILAAAREVTGRRHLRVEWFNDHRDTTHPMVLAVLARAQENIRCGVPFGQPPAWKATMRDLLSRFA